MRRDKLILIGLLGAGALTGLALFSKYEMNEIFEATDLSAPNNLGRGTSDVEIPTFVPRGPQVLIFSELSAYTEWYLSHHDERGFDLKPPETVDFDKDQVVAIIWGDKPECGYWCSD